MVKQTSNKTPDNIASGICGDCLDRIELNAASCQAEHVNPTAEPWELDAAGCQAEQYVNPTAEPWELDAADRQVRQKDIDPWIEFAHLIEPGPDSPPEAIMAAAQHTRVPA